MDLLTRIATRARGKSLYDLHPELTTRYPIMRVMSDEQAGASDGNFAQASTDYQRSTWVHKAIKVLADNFSALEFRVVTGKGREATPVEGHAITELLSRMNDAIASDDMRRQWMVDMMLGGEVGWEVTRAGNGKAREMWPRQPQTLFVIPDKAGQRYFKVARYKIDDGLDDPYFLEPNELIHFKFYNPLNPWRGLAPISAIRMSIVIDQLAQAWSRLFFRNSARPDYAVIAPEGLGKTERKELELDLINRYGGPENAHKPLILEEKVTDIKVFSYPPKDMEWVAQRELSRDEIGAIFGVPDEVMGYGRDTYENFQAALRALWSITEVPLVRFHEGNLTWFFRRTGELGADQRVEADLSQVQELQEAEDAKWTRSSGQISSGALMINEWREQNGMDPVPWGNVWWASALLSPVSGEEREHEPVPEQLLPPGDQPPEDQPDDESPPEDEPAEDEERAVILRDKAIELGSARHEAIWKFHQARVSPFVSRMQKQLRKEIKRQQNGVAGRLRNSRVFGQGQFKPDTDRIPPVTELFDATAEAARWEREFGPVVSQALLSVAVAELAEIGVPVEFDITRPEVQTALRQVLQTFAQRTNQTTYDELVGLFVEAEQAGEGIPAIMARLDVFFEGRASEFQTERIARTTMTAASNSGSIQAWEQAEVVKGKTWISALIPGRTRDEHADAHGQSVGLREMFTVGGELLAHPGDPNGSAGNIIHCLCTLIADIGGEEAAHVPAVKAPVSKPKETDMPIHVHVHLPENLIKLPDSMRFDLPAPQVHVDVAAAPAPHVDVHLAAGPDVHVSAPVTVEARPGEMKVQLEQPAETTDELEVTERHADGRPKKLKRTRRRK